MWGRTSQGSDLHSGPTRESDTEMCHLMDLGSMEDLYHDSMETT
jgi:hypothetical protein